MTELKEYRGNCHCGGFRFKISILELTAVEDCKCSFCLKNGVIWNFPVSKEALTIETNDWEMAEYEFGVGSNTHLFCPRCGSSVLSRGKGSKGDGINIRMLQDIDIDNLKHDLFPGASIAEAYAPPRFPSTESFGEIEDGPTVYNGSCHCGTITYAVKTKPLKEQEVIKCNCSLCSKNGDLFIYPPASSMILEGQENLVGYAFLSQNSLHSFCKRCGSSVCVQILGGGEDFMPLNVRTIDGVDLEELKYKNYDGASEKPVYTGKMHTF